MRSLITSLAVLAACSHGSSSTTPRGSWHGADTLASVPADSPYVLAWLEAPPEAVRKRLTAQFDKLIVDAIKKAAALPLDQRLALPPIKRAMLGIADAAAGKDPNQYWENLGFKHNGQWILYGEGIWPVLRIEVSDANKLRAVLADAVKTAAMPDVAQKELSGQPYWVASKDGLSGVVSVTEHDAVVALVPTATMTDSLPYVLGMKAPAKNLRDAGTIAQLQSTHHLTTNLITVFDMHNVVTALERSDMFATTLFKAPACHADYERIADAMPRAIFGYHKLDAGAFDASLILELQPDTAKQLAALHTVMPAPIDPAHELVSFVVAGDVDGGIAVVEGWLKAIQDRPFECQQLAITKEIVPGLMNALASVIPPELHGIKGGELVIDDINESPPSGSGYAIVAGDQIATSLQAAMKKLPPLLGTFTADGQPVALPVAMLGMDGIKTAFLALHPARLAVAVGDGSRDEVVKALAAPNVEHLPFAKLDWDYARFIAKMPSFMKDDNKESWKQFDRLMMAFDVREGALVVDIGATWRN
ncbi:MAG: hypothetical protein QM831_34920 [Kofleriaceae bacterium]